MSRTTMTFDGDSTPFRSRIEQEIANELDDHFVSWSYEQPVDLGDGQRIYYLPDFTIHSAPAELSLPRWVEGKPQQFLYDLRDSLGVTRAHGDRFQGEIEVTNVDSARLKSMHIEELWKPKKLAEMSGDAVLVVGGVGGKSRLSVEMRSESIVFTRHHPFVNWPAVVEERRRVVAQQRAEEERRRADEERRRALAEREQEAERVRRQNIFAIVKHRHIENRYESTCYACSNVVLAGGGYAFRVPFTNGTEGWVVLCVTCRRKAM